MKQKAFFINFKGLLLKQTKNIFLEGESPVLRFFLYTFCSKFTRTKMDLICDNSMD